MAEFVVHTPVFTVLRSPLIWMKTFEDLRVWNEAIELGEWLQFLGHARGSLYELRTLIVIAERLKYVDETQRTQLAEMTDAVGKTLSGLIKYVTSKR